MRKHSLITLLLVAALAAPNMLVAQAAGDITPSGNVVVVPGDEFAPGAHAGSGGVADLSVEFAGYDYLGRAQYLVRVRLEAGTRDDGVTVSYLLQLRDAYPHAIDVTDERSQATIVSEPDEPSEHTVLLSQAWFHVGPLYLDVMQWETGEMVQSIGPLQIPVYDAGLTPFGQVRQRSLHLHTEGRALAGTNIFFRVYGLQPGMIGILGFSAKRTETALGNGTLLIGPDDIFPVFFMANADGEVEIEILTEPWMEGMVFYTQALARTVTPEGEDGVAFSNGIEIAMEPRP
jgi:hypothetical protein